METAGTRASEHGWLRRLAGYCWRYRRTVLVALAGALAATVATAAIPLIQRQIIDNVIVTHQASIWPLAGLLLVAAAVNFGGIYLRRYRGGRLSLDVQHDLRTELFDRAVPAGRHAPGRDPHRAAGRPVHLRPEHGAGHPVHGAGHARQPRAVRADPRHHGGAVPGAHPRHRRGRARAVHHRDRVAAQAVPGELGRAAAVRRGGRGGGRGHRRGAGGQGVRPGGAGTGAAGGERAGSCSRPGCG